MPTNNQATTRGPRLNALADQFRQHRKDLITKVKDLRAQRAALRGVKGSSKHWAALSEEIDSVQNQIDKLSTSLGIPVKPQVVIVSPKPVHNPSWDKQFGKVRPVDTKAVTQTVDTCKVQNRGQTEQVLHMDSPAVEGDYQSSPEDFQ